MADLGKRFTEMLDKTATQEDVAKLFETLVQFLVRFKEETNTAIAQHKRLQGVIDETRQTSKQDVRDLANELRAEVAYVESLIPAVPDLAPLEAQIKQALAELAAQIPKLPEELSATGMRDKLESLQGNERLDRTAIKGLDEALSEVKTLASNRVQTPAKAFMIHKVDLSAACDGNTKTFSVGGSHFGIMGVYSTEFPIIYRPVIDYTETATGFTLTAAVSAPAAGQTLIAQFIK